MQIAPARQPQKRRNPPRTYGMRLRGDEWQVHHGSKTVARYANEIDAENHLRRILSLPQVQQ